MLYQFDSRAVCQHNDTMAFFLTRKVSMNGKLLSCIQETEKRKNEKKGKMEKKKNCNQETENWNNERRRK